MADLTKEDIHVEAQENLARQQELVEMAFGWGKLGEGVRKEQIPYEVKALNTRLVWLLGQYQRMG